MKTQKVSKMIFSSAAEDTDMKGLEVTGLLKEWFEDVETVIVEALKGAAFCVAETFSQMCMFIEIHKKDQLVFQVLGGPFNVIDFIIQDSLQVDSYFACHDGWLLS